MNGWDNLNDNNLAKTVIAQISLIPNDKVGLYLNWLGGNEDTSTMTADSIKSYKHLSDITASFAVSKKVNVGVNAAFGSYDFDTLATQNWGGTAVYIDYSFSEHFALGVRAEYFDDESGRLYCIRNSYP